MKRLTFLLFTMSLITCGIALGRDTDRCAPRTIHREIYPDESSKDVAAAMRTKVTLSSRWEDYRILVAFGFANTVAERESVPGVDGSPVRYRAGKTIVNIVRSVSTGLVVTVSNGPYMGAWLLESCD
jgi:hypothetical protein